ncbi:GTP cyclohydrolase FolE2 [Vibrio viridaestus]|uniref:GTP cyclohydrolase FolE2 n=1 Tax=Vibrio viridaestus TaxID=2487322 RepID=A0A3N9TFS0_9VIBR|nr:GTP cyclohydrolase FolE2 [Vibrio viridaestus]RQW62744.1 GTP cyclohydrolase I FolE2 [Vibrio viridaestus]
MDNYHTLPDITTTDRIAQQNSLQWVGMEGISVPIKLVTDDSIIDVSATINVFVSLDDATAKGIHMSRLYLKLNEHLAGKVVRNDSIGLLLEELLSSQQGLSSCVKLDLTFEYTLKKKALISELYGYQHFPVSITVEKRPSGVEYFSSYTIPYSSTCPCSASLSRHSYCESIESAFPGSTIDKQALLSWLSEVSDAIATPHSQRSFAYIKLTSSQAPFEHIETMLRHFESVLATSVQTAVKRVDEKAFAELNAKNLMFCEDAARRVKIALESLKHVNDYWFKVEHQESLHAHNAVVIDQKYR